MHSLTTFISEQLERRGWLARDLVRQSGLSKQVVSRLLNDGRDELVQRPDDATIDGLARAFNVPPAAVLARVGEAMGIPVAGTVPVPSVATASNDELLGELARRLREADRDAGEVISLFGSPSAAQAGEPVAAHEPSASVEELEAEQEGYEEYP